MNFLKDKRKRKIFITAASIVLVLAIITWVCASYVGDYYRADQNAIETFAPMNAVSTELLDGGTLVFKPENATKGFVFYPGGKVEYTAYQPLMAACAQQGILCILVEMPFNLADHASIIDGVRLCKAARYRYANNDMADLEAKLQEAKAAGARTILISTDGVFSMDGIVASLDKIHELAEKYGAIVHFDESHATGVLGARGRGTHEHCGLFGKVDITTGTFGKALGGASGGYVSGPKEVIDMLRQKSRPYLFSNSVMPAIAATTIKVIDMLEASTELTERVQHNAAYFRKGMEQCGFTLAGAGHAIVPVMLGDAALSQRFSNRLLELGVYAMGFFYPVVPKEQARIRTQLSAAHTEEQLDRAIAAFAQAGRELGVIK